METVADSQASAAILVHMCPDPLELRDAARAEYHARWEAVETFKAQELAALTEERAWHIIRSLRPFTDVPPDPFNGLGLVDQQTIFHRHRVP